jgi:hypothetical protein
MSSEKIVIKTQTIPMFSPSDSSMQPTSICIIKTIKQ